VIQGLLYVPDVAGFDNKCNNDSLSLIPPNVTRRNDFPQNDYPFIALAPWTDAQCVQSYLSIMRTDAVHGAIFFQNDTTTAQPTQVSDPMWSLHDGGRWKSQNQFPIWALPGSLGTFLLTQLSLYSGNMSSAPFGDQLVKIYNPSDSVRLCARVNISSNMGLPSLWVSFTAILALILVIVFTTSVIMHLTERRQRTLLSRRVARGEVDLEALGIKRLNVPRHLLDKMPQYTYTSKPQGVPETPSEATPREVPFSQPTCPICLDDFVHAETIIRELPCNHIFHPECIDPFLCDNSSLCPMCKKSALPPGYCPVNVTDIMVRRERLIRQMRQRNQPEQPVSRVPIVRAIQRHVRTLSMPTAPPSVVHRSHVHGYSHGDTEIVNVVTPSTRWSTTPLATGTGTGNVSPTVQGANAEEVPAVVRAQGTSARRAWMRESLARRQEQQYDEHAQTARQVDVGRPLCEFPFLEMLVVNTVLTTDYREEDSGSFCAEIRTVNGLWRMCL
jgi:Ring finger domain